MVIASSEITSLEQAGESRPVQLNLYFLRVNDNSAYHESYEASFLRY